MYYHPPLGYTVVRDYHYDVRFGIFFYLGDLMAYSGYMSAWENKQKCAFTMIHDSMGLIIGLRKLIGGLWSISKAV